MSSIKREIAELIGDLKTNEAFDLAKTHFPEHLNQLAPLEGNFKRINKMQQVGAMDMNSYNTESAKVAYNLLNIISAKDGDYAGQNRMQKLIAFKKDFLKRVIGEFARSKFVLFGSLAFVVVVGLICIFNIGFIMPTNWGRIVFSITLVSFFTLVISALGFMNLQIKQFENTKTFLKLEEYTAEEE